jgi:hypothetical protein
MIWQPSLHFASTNGGGIRALSEVRSGLVERSRIWVRAASGLTECLKFQQVSFPNVFSSEEIEGGGEMDFCAGAARTLG